jgi:methyltransferase (TIGR00027 family)
MDEPSTQATRSKRSFTAEAVAALRAIGQLEKDPAIRNPDHLAVRFLGSAMRTRVRFWPVRKLTLWTVDRMLPGGYLWITARTKHLDRIVLDEVAAGVRQVVILGAGADSRAYRFVDELAGAMVFELDHPLTSAWKQQQVRTLFGQLPEHVRYVPIDLAHETLETGLSSVEETEPVVFIWEGVAPYLSREAVESILATVARCAPGSSIAFDYVYADAVQRMKATEDANRFDAYVRRRGEPLASGLDPDALGQLAGELGLEVESNARPAELAARHLHEDSRVVEFSAIAHLRRR